MAEKHFHTLLLTALHSDIDLITNTGRVLPLHKAVLALRSEALRAIVERSCAEQDKTSRHNIESAISDLDDWAVCAVVAEIYLMRLEDASSTKFVPLYAPCLEPVVLSLEHFMPVYEAFEFACVPVPLWINCDSSQLPRCKVTIVGKERMFVWLEGHETVPMAPAEEGFDMPDEIVRAIDGLVGGRDRIRHININIAGGATDTSAHHRNQPP